jgi:nitroimidazol reductase NimA-like FMN-containing flavoprotein (pyridoxamine 5'-phosphate oxidase superfamily)
MNGKARLEVLTPQECLHLLRTTQVGRLAFIEGDLPAVHPVNYALHGQDIVIRIAGGGKLAAGQRGDVLAFEVDDIDPRTHTGWSVLVVGGSSIVTDIAQLVEMASPESRPWAEGRREQFLRIAADRITGRRLSLGSTPSTR